MKSVLKTLMLGAFVVLSACAKDSGGGGSNPAANVATVPGTCPNANEVYTTQYGCLPQGGCQSGFVTYQNQCIVATANTCQIGQVNTQYGCLPQGNCGAGQALLNTQCVAAIQGGYNNGYPTGYVPGGSANAGFYWQGGGNYYGNTGGNYYGNTGGSYYYNNPYRYRRYQGGVGINAGFYIGAGVGTSGYYGF